MTGLSGGGRAAGAPLAPSVTFSRMNLPTRVGVLLGAALLISPVAAQAAKKPVGMGVPPSVGKPLAKALEKQRSEPNAFFPAATTIHVGDSVAFAPYGFHNVDIPAKGGQPTPLIGPSGKTVSGANDAAGSPFWFNGQPDLQFRRSLMRGLYGKTVTYDGSKAVNSGLPLGPRLKPLTVRFTKAGTYRYFCDVHPGMTGTVKVVGKRARVSSPAAVAKVVKTQAAAALKTAKRLASTRPASGTIQVGAAGPGGVERMAFFPSKLTVAPGTTIRFAMAKGSHDVHTASTGPGNPMRQPKSYLGKLAGSFQGPAFDPAAVYPSDMPPAVASLTPTLHGNGFWSSGVLDTATASPNPSSSSVRFAAPGKYDFYCLIHPFMKATVTVQ